jgi:hypothetical protein
MPDQQPDSNVEKARITYALWLAVIGFLIAASVSTIFNS